MEYHLGNMTQKAAQRLTDALHGKTYMKFSVNKGIAPGPSVDVYLETDHPEFFPGATDTDILTFAISVLAGSGGP